MSQLVIPEAVLGQHVAILGKTGAGKSSVLRYLVEHLLSRGKRVCIIDPKGDHWGLKSSADGRGPGFPVIAFGDFKNADASDVPINQHSGKHIAELVASGNRPCIIGLRGWMTSHLVQFWIDFASGIFNANHGELYLVGDEFHNFAPKGKIMDPQAGKCLHWSNRLLSEGRGLGIVCLIASQRPQKVHNDTLTSCETLVAMRVIHASDRTAVKEWIEGCGDMEQGKQVLNSLAGMDRGSAFVWCPEAGYGPQVVRFPMFKTFDSFAPPQLQKKVSGEGWSTVDLAEVKARLAAVIEEHKENDPKHLKAELARLSKELADRKPEDKRVEIPVISEEDLATVHAVSPAILAVSVQLKELETAVQKAQEKIDDALGVFRAIPSSRKRQSKYGKPLEHPLETVREYRETAVHPQPAAIAVSGGNGTLAKCDRALLTVVVQNHPAPVARRKIALCSGYSVRSSGFSNALSALRVKGYIQGSDPVACTPEGVAALGSYERLPEGREAIRYWIGQLDKCPSTLLSCLLNLSPMTRQELAAASGYSLTSSGFSNGLSELRTRELITGKDRIEIIL